MQFGDLYFLSLNMREVSLAILSTLFFCILSVNSVAQNAQHPWSISAGAVFLKYHAPSSLSPLEGATYQPAVQVSLGKYLGGAFDFRTQITASHQIAFPAPLAELPSNTVKSMLMDMSYLLAFKINNGVFLKQNSFFGPYILFGLGGSYVENNPDVYIPFGGGIKFRLNDRMDLRVETSKKFSVNKDFQHTAHALSFAYNVGQPRKRTFRPSVSEEKIIEDTKPLDTDGDGVLDVDDLCPEEVGPSRLFGCPDESEEEITATDNTAADEVQEELNKPEKAEQKDASVETEEEEEKLAANKERLTEEVAESSSEKIEEEAKVQEPKVPLPIAIEEKGSAESLVTPETTSSKPVIEQKTTPFQTSTPSNRKKSYGETPPVEEKEPCNIQLSTNDFSIYFDHASIELPEIAKRKLDEVAASMQVCTSSRLVLQGHTDAIGADRNNKALSVVRAHRVKYYLVYEHGISQSRIESEGYGETKPKADNDTDSGRERNRRVDFTLIK